MCQYKHLSFPTPLPPFQTLFFIDSQLAPSYSFIIEPLEFRKGLEEGGEKLRNEQGSSFQ
jgi:hypothetical protein